MSFTYAGDPSASTLAALRFKLMDTVEAIAIFTDEELAYAQTEYTTTSSLMTFLLQQAILKLSQTSGTVSLGPHSQTLKDRIETYKCMLAKYQSIGFASTLASHVTSDKIFTIGMHDNPQEEDDD